MRSDSKLEPPHLEPISYVHQMVAKVLDHGLYPNPLKSAQQLKQEVVHKKDALWDRCERYSAEKWGSDAQRFGALHKEKDAIPSIVGSPDWFTDLTQISVLNKRIVAKINIVLYRCESSVSEH